MVDGPALCKMKLYHSTTDVNGLEIGIRDVKKIIEEIRTANSISSEGRFEQSDVHKLGFSPNKSIAVRIYWNR